MARAVEGVSSCLKGVDWELDRFFWKKSLAQGSRISRFCGSC